MTVPACFNRYFDLANSEVAEGTLPAEDDAADSEVVEPAEPSTVTPEDDTGIRGGPFSDNIHKYPSDKGSEQDLSRNNVSVTVHPHLFELP